MYTSIVILVVIASILMCLIVLVQESKGGGLAADYTNNNQILGAPKTTSFIEKATWTLIGIIVFLSIISVAFTKKTKPAEEESDQPAYDTRNSEDTQEEEGTTGDYSTEAQNQAQGENL